MNHASTIFYNLSLTFIILCLPLGTAWAKMPTVERESMLAAVEDYHFGDYEEAIKALADLHLRYPSNIDMIKYLSLSYEESKQLEKAEESYAAWMKLGNNLPLLFMRDAWLGYVRVLEMRRDDAKAINTVQRWNQAYPSDHDVSVIYGRLLTKQAKFEQADLVWQHLISQPNISATHRAAAHYFKAKAALSAGNEQRVQQEVQLCLQAQPDGKYARLSKQLLIKNKNAVPHGFLANASIGYTYSNNVELLPDIVQPALGQEKSDNIVQLNLALNYQDESYLAGYTLNSSMHHKHTEFDIIVHTLLFDWVIGSWTLGPRVEMVSLSSENLYTGGGVDVSWKQGDWMTKYKLRSRQFTETFGALSIDLSRLSGLSHELGINHPYRWGSHSFLWGGYVHQESTKGDVLHNKTDDYTEAGINLTWSKPWTKSISSNVFSKTYWRGYSKADTNILLSGNDARSDIYFQLGGNLGFQPFSSADNRIILQAAWQNNASNYKAPLVVEQSGKEYTEWKAGASWQYLW